MNHDRGSLAVFLFLFDTIFFNFLSDSGHRFRCVDLPNVAWKTEGNARVSHSSSGCSFEALSTPVFSFLLGSKHRCHALRSFVSLHSRELCFEISREASPPLPCAWQERSRCSWPDSLLAGSLLVSPSRTQAFALLSDAVTLTAAFLEIAAQRRQPHENRAKACDASPSSVQEQAQSFAALSQRKAKQQAAACKLFL